MFTEKVFLVLSFIVQAPLYIGLVIIFPFSDSRKPNSLSNRFYDWYITKLEIIIEKYQNKNG